MRKINILLIIFVIAFSINSFAASHVIKLKITNTNSSTSCIGTWCQVYAEIPAKLYIDKGWLRSDLKNLRFNDGIQDLNYWVIDKKDKNYKINKLGLWLLVYNLQPNSTKYINMIIDNNNSTTYCNPGADYSVQSYNRSSYECAASVFPFYTYNLNDWKWTKYPDNYNWYDPDTKFINNYLYSLNTVWPGKSNSEAVTGNEFTLRIDNMKFYKPSGKYYSEAKIYFLSQAPYNKPQKMKSKPGYRIYIKKAHNFGSVSDDLHYSSYRFIIKLQRKVSGSGWVTQANTDWYVYNNSRYVFDIKVSDNSIALYINGEHLKLSSVQGDIDVDGNYKRPEDDFDSGHFGINRLGWKLCCGTDINYIILRHYFKNEPKVEVYGNVDLVVGKGTADKGENYIELTPDIQKISSKIGGNTLDKYVFATFNIARENQIIKDFKLKIKNRSNNKATFYMSPIQLSNVNDWMVYWCDKNGNNCTLHQPSYIDIQGNGSKEYTLKVFSSSSILFNGGELKINIKMKCLDDLSFDNAEFVATVNPKLSCYWKYKMPIKIDWKPAHGYTNLINYQVLINLNGVSELKYARDDGSDIIVTDSYGNKIPFWIKKFDKQHKKLDLWVKAPIIYPNITNPQIYVWWGNSEFKVPKSNMHETFDLYEDWSEYPLNVHVGCPDGTTQCASNIVDPRGWKNIPTPDDNYNWWWIKEFPSGNKILQANMSSSFKSHDTGPYLFNGNVAWDHYEIYYKMNAGHYNQYNGNPWGNPQYNPVFTMDAGNMWGMEFFTDKFIFRPYASGIDYTWQYQTYVKNLIGESFPKKNKWYWVKVKVFKDKITQKAYLKVEIANKQPTDIDNDTNFITVGDFVAPPVFALPHGKIGFGGWDSGFYFDDIRVRKFVIGIHGKEPVCNHGVLESLTPREKISLSQPQITPPLFEGRAAYIVSETKPFSWLGDVKAYYADCYIGGSCQSNENQGKLGTISIFGKINDTIPKGLGYYLMKSEPGTLNRSNINDSNWIVSGRYILTHLDNLTTHKYDKFDYFDLSNCSNLKEYLGTTGTCLSNDNFIDDTEKLIEFVRGFYIKDFPKSQGRNMDSVLGYGNQDGKAENNEQWKLGDILHSNPLVVGIPNMLYADDSYSKFVNKHRDRPLVIYFMSNEGMLHAFEIAKYDKGRYKPLSIPIELWSYIPEGVLRYLKDTTKSDHHYLADGLLRAIDIKDGSDNWKTILLGISGREKEYIFAIDITDPIHPKFLWEINSLNHIDMFDRLGIAISSPALGKLNNKWIAVFGSGYSTNFIQNYTTKKAYLTFIDILTGKIIKQVKVSNKVGNVITDITTARDVKGNIEDLYFGDYYGVLWRIQANRLTMLSDNSTLDPSKDMLFMPVDYAASSTPSEVKRPIIVRPVIAKDKSGKWWVFFGTGDYDEYDPHYPHQRFYGLKDDGVTIYSDGAEINGDTVNNIDNMTSTSSAVNNLLESWFIELGYNDSLDQTLNGNISQKDNNERVLQPAEVYGGYTFFTTYQPINNPCGGGKSRFYAVGFNTGKTISDLFAPSGTPKKIRSLELNGKGVSSKPMIYTGRSGDSNVVATGLVNSSSGKLEKIDLNPNKFIETIDIKLWRKIK